MRSLLSLTCIGIVALFTACGSSDETPAPVASGGGGGSANTGGGSANTGGGSANTGGGAPTDGGACPATIVDGVTACTVRNQRCASGNESCVCTRTGGRDAGTMVFQCNAVPDSGFPGFDGSYGNCPGTAPQDGDTCTAFAYCPYGNVNCMCIGGGGNRSWNCN
jgi:hypothetical protein